ncbi:MAG: phage holin family protein [Phycisphaerae bacterium]
MRSQRKASGNGAAAGELRGAKAPLGADAVAPEVEALRATACALSEVCEHLRQLAQVRIDQLRLDVRARLRRGLLLVTGAALGFVVLLIGVGYASHGVALGLAAACGGRTWLGYLLAGVLFIGVTVASVLVIDLRRRTAAWSRLWRKYARDDAGATEENDGVALAQARNQVA